MILIITDIVIITTHETQNIQAWMATGVYKLVVTIYDFNSTVNLNIVSNFDVRRKLKSSHEKLPFRIPIAH